MRKQPAWVPALSETGRAMAKAERSMVKAAERERKAREETDIILHNFAALNPKHWNEGRHTCSRAAGKLLIEHGITFSHGRGYRARTKSLGCGVYHILFDEV